ncbi:MAG: ABC transporter ATP-binding protein [Candidatus Thorarchaeota archaeon]|nr:MAG: ABC transporter ATP-binding protein [Candidatus Thorarchaeota archaeon]
MSMGDLLSVRNLTVEYRTRRGVARALDNVSVSLPENTTLGLAGESGCGKSTLGRSIIRLVPYPGVIVGGEIIFSLRNDIEYDGQVIPKGEVDLVTLPEEAMRKLRGEEIAYIFQDPMTSLNPMITIADHFVELITTHNPEVTEEEALERAGEILDSLGILPERMTDYPHQFSGGMRQRVMIGLGLALRPRLLIADEPTTSLDVIVEAQILDEITQLKEKFNLTMILITHNLGVLAQHADNIAIIYAGRLMELADTETLFENPQHPYTKALLSAVPDVRKPEKKLAWIPGAPPDLTKPLEGCMYHPRCPMATDRCRVEQPPLVKSPSGGLVACHLY